jgi:hypothetical protein
LRYFARAAAAVLLLSVSACGEDDDDGPVSTGTLGMAEIVDIPCPELPPDPSRVRVMVVDEGFDPRHPIFANKIAGCYRLNCPDTPDEGGPREFASDDDAAAQYLEDLSTPSPECDLQPGIRLRVDSYLEHFEPKARAEWNEVMFQKKRLARDTRLDSTRLLSALLGLSEVNEFDAPETLFSYHGTGTAGVLAYGSDVQLVLVERELGDAQVEPEDYPCIDPEDLALEMRLLERPEVREAWVRAPLSGMDETLRDLRRAHGVSVENRSFGAPSTDTLEGLLAAQGCPEVPFREYLGVVGELDREREAYLRGARELDRADPLVFQAAGNNRDRVNSSEDLMGCTPDRARRLLIGSYDIIDGVAAVSDFSNTGDCIDLYAFGDSVIAPAPNGFYVPLSGTSFASPLAARYAATLLARSEADLPSLRDEVLSARDALRFLPLSTMPTELGFYSLAPIRVHAAPVASSALLGRRLMRPALQR